MFTSEDISRIKMLLGYIEFPTLEPDVETRLNIIEDPIRYEKIMNLVFEIESLEQKISEFIPKTFIQNVDGIQLDYIKVVNQLKQEASRKLNLLANIASLNVRYDQFSNSKKISFTSIW